MRKYLLSILCALFLLSGCNYLDMVPEKDIETIETIFEQRTKVEAWWLGLHGDVHKWLQTMRNNLSYTGAGEVVGSPLLNEKHYMIEGVQVAKGLQMSQEPYGSIWNGMYIVIRNANTFLENIHRTYNMTEEDRAWWTADVKALKAFIYFELVRTYGPVCLVPQNMPVDLPVENYQLPRQHVDTCFKEIIRLLDEAEPDVPVHAQRVSDYYGFSFTKEAIAALKAKVLLYAASPLFNGNAFYSDFKNKNGEPLFSSTYDHEKWKLAAEAADRAADICDQGDRELPKGGHDKKTKLLNYISDIEQTTFSQFNNKEYLLEWKGGLGGFVSYTLPRVDDRNHFEPYAMGILSPSMKMVEMYYTDHGLPINMDNTWTFSNRNKPGSESSHLYEGVVALNTRVVNLHLRREPRFYAHIAGDRMYWQRGINTLTRDNNLLVEARKDEKWGTKSETIVNNDFQNICGYWLKKHIFSWIPTQNYSTYLRKNETTPIIRLAEVYMMQAEAWNEYLEKPNDKVYGPLDKVRVRAGILPVKEAWQTYSLEPTKVESKEGMRDIIRQEYNIEFAFEAHRYWDIRRWLIAHEEMNEEQFGWNILGTSFESFYNNGDGPIPLGIKYKFIAPRDYFAPFKAEEILISGMRQNVGW